MRKRTLIPICVVAGALSLAVVIKHIKEHSRKLVRTLDTYISPDTLEGLYDGSCIAERVISLVADKLELDINKQEIVCVETMDPNMVFIVIVGEGYRHEMMYGMDTEYLCCDQYRCKK